MGRVSSILASASTVICAHSTNVCSNVSRDREEVVSWDPRSVRVFTDENAVLKLVLPLILFYVMDFSDGGTLVSTCFCVD